MFDHLSQRFQDIFKQLRSHGRLGPKEIDNTLREIRRGLLEADAPYRIIQDFLERVKNKASDQKVLRSITPAQQIQKIVLDELTHLLGDKNEPLTLTKTTIIMTVGLQGSGKTTTCAKLAKYFQKKGFHPFLIPADQKRAAATHQLISLAKKIDCRFTNPEPSQNIAQLCQTGIEEALQDKLSPIIIDTAGRNHIDETLMNELSLLKQAIKPNYIILAVDAMTGQDAVKSTQSFHEKLDIQGAILTKLDGDARGGAAISMKAVTGRPILFAGTGEDLTALEPFYPDRMASRILAIGDIKTLVERVDAASKSEEKSTLIKEKFDLNDLLSQIRQMKKMGSLKDLLPSIGLKQPLLETDGKQISRTEAMILSMTPYERAHPEIINGSRRNRIAKGSGTRVQDINQLLKQVQQMQKVSKSFSKRKLGKSQGDLNFLWKNLK